MRCDAMRCDAMRCATERDEEEASSASSSFESIPPRYLLDTVSIPPRWETSTRAVVRAGRRIIDIGIETGPRVGRRRASRRTGAVARSDG